MNENNIKLSDFLQIAMKSVIVGLGIYLILSGIIVVLLWFTSVPEGLITYLSPVCLSAGCFVSGLKLGSSAKRKGIIMGIISAMLLSSIILSAAIFLSQGDLWNCFSVIKLIAAMSSGIVGGMIGVNTAI